MTEHTVGHLCEWLSANPGWHNVDGMQMRHEMTFAIDDEGKWIKTNPESTPPPPA